MVQCLFTKTKKIIILTSQLNMRVWTQMLSLTHTYEHDKLSIWWCSFIIFIKVLKLEFKKKKKANYEDKRHKKTRWRGRIGQFIQADRQTGRWSFLLARSLRSSPDPRATEEKATAASSISGKSDGSELIHRWRPAPEGTSLVSNKSLCLRNTLKCYHMER